MKKFKVVISRNIVEPAEKLLIHQGINVVCHNKQNVIKKDELIELCQDADGLISMLADQIDADFIDSCPKLKVISNYAVGYNNIDVKYANQRGIRVGNTPNVLTDATADVAFALLFSVARRINESSKELDQWITWEPMGYLGQGLKEKILGIVGMGRIGEAMAKRCHFGLDMKILYTANGHKEYVEKTLGAKKVDLDELLAKSDFISLHCPLTEQTKHMINKNSFELMKSTAILINTARGDIIDQDALIDALESKKIFGAGLDVTTPEPLPMNSKLHKLKNVVITPHIGSADIESRSAMSELCAKNILSGLIGEKLPAEVLA